MESAMRVAMRQMLGIFAELDRKSIKYKLRAGRDKKRAKYGRCEGRKIYGTHPEHPEEKEIIARILALRAKGTTLAGIAAKLNHEGITTRSGGKWFEQQVVRIINRAKQSV
jgi:DNA invertase Pin-like site-specific DNA recombinase